MFAFHRGDGFDAQNPFSKAQGSGKAPFSQQRYGGFLGGPIVRDRLHYFGSYEGLRQRETSVITATLVPVDRARRRRTRPTAHQCFIKIDSRINDKHSMQLRYRADKSMSTGNGIGGLNTRERGTNSDSLVQDIVGNLTTILSVAGVERSSASSAARHSIVDRHRRLEHRRHAGDQPALQPLRQGATTSRRAATRTGCSSSTTSPTRSASHDLKAGADISIIRAPTFFPRNGDGTFTFTTDRAVRRERPDHLSDAVHAVDRGSERRPATTTSTRSSCRTPGACAPT